MANLFEYLAWRGDLDFSVSPFNPVDNVILCQLSYLPFDGIVPSLSDTSRSGKNGITIREAAEIFKVRHENNTDNIRSFVMFKDDPVLLDALAASKRFGNCRLSCYENHIDDVREIQFSAIFIDTGDASCFAAYRGTDLSLVGWKEDFNMSFCDVVPAQLEAVDYLTAIAKKFKGRPLRLGGHSKGGNLAVFAASNCVEKIQKRIRVIYSNDAPGFHDSVIESEGFAAIESRIKSYVPQFSIVGMLLEFGCEYTVIKSSKPGLLQHELYTWEVAYNDMIHVDEVTQGSRFVKNTIKQWIESQDLEKREQFFNALYSILLASEAKSLPELEKSWFHAVTRMIRTMGSIDNSTRKLMRNVLADLFNAARNNIDMLIRPRETNKI